MVVEDVVVVGTVHAIGRVCYRHAFRDHLQPERRRHDSVRQRWDDTQAHFGIRARSARVALELVSEPRANRICRDQNDEPEDKNGVEGMNIHPARLAHRRLV